MDLTTHTCLSPIRRVFAPSFVNYKKECTRLAAASGKDYQLLAQGRWFSPGTPASSITKTGRHYIAEILLKVALNSKIQIQIQILVNCRNCYLWSQLHVTFTLNKEIVLRIMQSSCWNCFEDHTEFMLKSSVAFMKYLRNIWNSWTSYTI